ncbi:MAG: hypothetical protein AAFQ37_00020 [Bacteroidota bacterium]
MVKFEELPSRRRVALVCNGLLVAITLLLGLLGAFSTYKDGAIWYLLLLVPLAILQWCCAIYNVLRGSRRQLYYLLTSLLYLALYWYSLEFWNGAASEDLVQAWLGGSPIVFALFYCVLLRIDDPANYRKEIPADDVLDSEFMETPPQGGNR